MASEPPVPRITIDDLTTLLEHDTIVKVAGIDVDGVLRGKAISKKKFLSVAENGFGFCSVVFGWDMHDQAYFKELKISNKRNGYQDLLAIPDLSSYRRIPWENNVPFFLLSYHEPLGKHHPISACPRGLLRRIVDQVEGDGFGALAGVEYEFYTFRVPSTTPSDNGVGGQTAVIPFLRTNAPSELPHMTEGMFGYSMSRPVINQDWYYGIFDACKKFDCGIEGWHTETGPGVFEAALEYGEVSKMADKASLFKYAVKTLGMKHGVTPCFMAKPQNGQPGNSGHMHISLVDEDGDNVFARQSKDPHAKWADIAYLSDTGRHFLAGLLDGLPDIMPLFAPTVNSYKRLVENFWAPVSVSWGFEHRSASIRLIGPPTGSGKATRFEVRTPGADANPHFVLAAILALGWRGVKKRMEISIPPLSKTEETAADPSLRLAKDLKAATQKFMRKESVAREVFGDEFVDHFGGTREHEYKLWEEAVTDWEVRRYIETV